MDAPPHHRHRPEGLPGGPDHALDLPDDRAAEQRYLDQAYRHLTHMSQRASRAAADAAERAPGDWDATVAQRRLTERVASLTSEAGPLCFGRIDEERGDRWYIGRRHVENDTGEPVVVDWRAPVAVPFYRATFRDPLGLSRRRRFLLDERRLVDLLDEDFAHPDESALASAAGLPDPLLAELGRARTGAMRDIVATIAAEQDRIIRAPLNIPLVVQGGPGTGKTAVGLHRAAFLLYEYRRLLERQGVLVIGPNRLFLSYIAEVLPSLGEVAVVQTTLSGLVPGLDAVEERSDIAALKGEAPLADVVARALRAALQPPESPLVVTTRWGQVTIAAGDASDMMESAMRSGGPVAQQRLRFRRAVARTVVRKLQERRGPTVVDADDVQADMRGDRVLQRALGRAWPTQSAAGVIRALLGRPSLLATAADGILSPAEQRLLHRRAARSLAAEPWTEADLVLVDEAEALLNGPPRQYGHVVVDEAQDLSAMAWRMVRRRSADGVSMTVLGDLAQATAPAALRSWPDVVGALGAPAGAVVEHLTTGYRVPAQIMDVANRLLPVIGAAVPATDSVRRTDDPPRVRRVPAAQLAVAVADEVALLLGEHASVGVVAPPGLHAEVAAGLRDRQVRVAPPGERGPAHVSLLLPAEAKGLEFDATVVVEPAAIAAGPGGAGLLYIALTRAVQHVTVLHARELPGALRAAA